MKQNRSIYLVLLTILSTAFMWSTTGCSPDDPDPIITDTTSGGSNNDFKTEFLEVNGVDMGQITSKKIIKNTGSRSTEIRVKFGPNYPSLTLVHEWDTDQDTMVAREYAPAKTSLYLPDLDLYEVGFNYSEGPAPNYCQYQGFDPDNDGEPPVPNEKYELKLIKGKYVSEFGKAQLRCNNSPAKGDDNITVEGYVIWEEM
ncbi:MAG: hypothetical protein ACI9JN_002719 [Bacteroidia bacterium]|jgi:hypothetical protein